jgi:acyl-coenzyme A thioesterase PaaI-like protein
MAYADSVGGFYAYNKVKKPIVTVNLNCNFIKPVSVGSWLEAKAKIKMCGKSLIFVEIEMFIKNKLVFSSNGVWKIINIAKR